MKQMFTRTDQKVDLYGIPNERFYRKVHQGCHFSKSNLENRVFVCRRFALHPLFRRLILREAGNKELRMRQMLFQDFQFPIRNFDIESEFV